MALAQSLVGQRHFMPLDPRVLQPAVHRSRSRASASALAPMSRPTPRQITNTPPPKMG
jgi:hypothetical protein